MRTNNIIKWAAMLTVSGLLSIIAPLTLSAAITGATGTNIAITAGSGTAQSDVVFDNAGNTTSPISVSTTGWYSGTRVVVTATATAANVGRNGVTLASSGTVNLTDSAITANLYGITASGTSATILNNTNVTTNAIAASAFGVYLQTASTLTMNGGTVTTGTGNTGYGLSLSGTSAATLNNVCIVTSSTNGHGINLAASSTLTMDGGTITTGTTGAVGVNAATASSVTLRDIAINAFAGGVAISSTSTGTLNNVNITTQNGVGVSLATFSTATVSGGTITTISGGNGIGLSAGSAIDMRDTVINAFAVGVNVAGTSVANLDNVSITTQNNGGLGLSLATSSTASFSGTIVTNGPSANGVNISGASTLTLGDNVHITVNISGGGIATSGSGNMVSIGDNLVINSGGVGISVGAGSAITAPVNNVNITTRNTSAHGINYTSGFAPLTVNGGTITTGTTGARGVYVGGTSHANLQNTVINSYAGGVWVGDSSYTTLRDMVVDSRNGGGIESNNATVIIVGGTYRTHDANANLTTIRATNAGVIDATDIYASSETKDSWVLHVSLSGTLLVNGGTVRSSGDSAHAFHSGVGNTVGSYAYLANLDIKTTGSGANILNMDGYENSSVRIIVEGGTAVAEQGSAIHVNFYASHNYAGDYDITIGGGATLSGTAALVVYGDNPDVATQVHVSVGEASALSGDVNTYSNSETVLSLAGSSTLTGNLIASGSSTLTVSLTNSVLTGASTVNDSATLALNVGGSAVWNVTGSSSLTTLNNSGTVIIANAQGEDLTISGAYTQDADGTLDVTVISGSGPVITADTASISGTLRLSGFTTGTAAAKASEIVAKNFTVIHTANGISGDFSTVDFGVAASAVDYITLAVGKTNSDRDYALNYGLSWFAASSTSHGNFTINSGTSFEIDITLSDTNAGLGAGGWDGKTLTKLGGGTLTVSSSNRYSGGTIINGGTLNLTNLSGLGSGTVNIENLASLRLGASGIFANNILATSGTTIIDSGASVTISGSNTLFSGTAPTVINGALFVPATGDFVYQNALTGTGALTVNNSGAFNFAASTGANFTGTVTLENNTFALTAANALPLTQATLVTGSGNLVIVDSDPAATSRNLGALSFSGGTVRFAGYDPHATRADTIIALTGTLSLSGGGTVEVVMPNPSQIPDGSKFTHIPLLQQDDGLALTLLISASGGVTGSPATLALRDTNGRVVSDSYTLNLSHDGVTTDAIGTYDYLLSTSAANDGLYVAFGLKQVDIQAGRTLTLDQDVTVPAEGDDFTATIIGAGNLNISAASSITLNGTGNSYSGTTTVSSGTLIVGADYNMFASSTAFVINSGAALNTGGFYQLVNNLTGSGLATFTGNTLTVNNSSSTSFSGTLSGSKLVKDGGAQLNANDAVANLAQVQVENGEIILGQNATVSASNNPAVIANGGTATFNNSALSTSGSTLILAKDNSPAVVNLNNMTVSVSGSGHLVEIDKGALTVNLNNTAAVGDISAFNGSTGLVNLTNNSVLTGRIDPVSVNIDHSTWNMTGRSRITTLHGANGGTITIDNVEGEDLTVSAGITGQTALNLTLSDSVKGNQEIWVVVDETNAMTGERFTLTHEVSYGMYNYNLVNANDGAWLVYTGSSGTIPPPLPPINPPTISDEGDTIINTAAAVAGFWFTQLDNLHKRMGELRYNKPAGGDLINNIWIRAYGQQINANVGIYSVKGFSETQYGVDLGTDYLWKLDADNQLYTGLFAGYGGADRDFHTSYSGNTDSGYGGVYATWINKDGWYADAVVKGQYFRNDFSGEDHAEYDSVGAGISLEVGNMFEFKDGWFVEPSAQFSYLHLMNDNYTTRDNLSVNLTDADILHIYGGARFGRNIKLTNSGMLQPYIKAGGLGQISSGNKLTVSGDHWRPNLDGARAVVGAGLIWQLDADSQLHLDYEASFGEKYDKPWGVNFGYRYQF